LLTTGSGDVSGSGRCDKDSEELSAELDLSLLTPRQRAKYERSLNGGGNSPRRLAKAERAELGKLVKTIHFDEPMSAHTTLGVGGAAEAFAIVESFKELKDLLSFINEKEIPYYFLGKGSNMLVRDGGLRGVVVQLAGDFSEIKIVEERDGEVLLSVGAAVSTTKFLRWCNEEGLFGHEILTGVPGSIGGNVITNAGTHVGCLADIVEEVTVLDKNIKEMTMRNKSLRFEYRSCKLPRSTAVLRAIFKLQKGDNAKAKEKFKDLLDRRRETQPVAMKSSGCIFKNAGKISASQLIDESGLKGVRVGKARISELHANFIVNEGGATAKDVLVLIHLIKNRVKQDSGIALDQEVVILGDEKNEQVEG
jgi:UDP-N-acetylmuramate dehydrogenase